MTQDGQQSADKKLAKPHTPVMMTQLNIRQGIKQFGEKGNELSQLHESEALLPLRKEHFCISCSQKKNVTEASK